MFERNPAGRATSVHFYDTGQLVDDYYYEHVEAIGNIMFEYVQHPRRVGEILGGRFAFLSKQPISHTSSIDNEEYIEFFDGEDLLPDKGSDLFSLNQTDLYVPFWENESLPFGAIYSLEEPFPDHFLKQHGLLS